MAGPQGELPQRIIPGRSWAWGPRALGVLALAIALASAAYFCFLHYGLLETYRHVLDLKSDPYHYYPNTIDWPALAIAVGAAFVLVLVGQIALQALDLYVPDLARVALAYVVGLGAVGTVVEVETIFGYHTRWTILGTIAVLVVLFALLAYYVLKQPVAHPFVPHWGRCRARIEHEYSLRYEDSLRRPTGPFAIAAYGLLLALIAVITLLTFVHGALCPVTYWDSLILYVGYAREIFYQHAFPFKAVAQVGIGLGANYPHLYALMAAATATVAGWWSDTFAQVAPPLAGLLSCVLVYHTVLRLTRHRLLSIALTAVFRAVPYGIAYFIYASDYSLVLLFTAAFFYVALLYLETGLTGYFVLATLIAAFGMHLNYLMGLLWVLWAAMVLLAHLRPAHAAEAEPLEVLDEADIPRDMVDLQTTHPQPLPLKRFLASQRFCVWFVVGILAASPWYVRNWVLTGNPAYAFFPSLFPGTIHYNQEVMDSARVEWTLNGDGIGKFALTPEFFREFDQFQRARDVSKMEIARINTPLTRKLALSWQFWVTQGNTWKLAPSLIGIALPGLLIFLLQSRWRRRLDLTDREGVAARRFGWLCVLMLFLLLAYHYLLADFYLYQIIQIVGLIPLFGVYFVRVLDGPPAASPVLFGKLTRAIFVALALWIAIFPGVPMALMGFKILSTVRMGEQLYSPFQLIALHRLGVDKITFYRLAFGEDAYAWVGLNTYCLDEKVLTHENRHLVIDRRVGIVHFDDWTVQALWPMSPDEQLEALREMGVTFYLFIANETKHQVCRRLGPPAATDVTDPRPKPWQLSALRGWIETGVLEPVDQFGDNCLYRFKYP